MNTENKNNFLNQLEEELKKATDLISEPIPETKFVISPIKQSYPKDFFRGIYGIGGLIAGGYAKQLLFSPNDSVDINYGKRIRASDVDIFMQSQDSEALDQMYRYLDVFDHTVSVADLVEAWKINDANALDINQHLFPHTIQLIMPTIRPHAKNNVAFGSPESLINGFDFSVTQAVVIKDGDDFKVLHHKDLVNHVFMKELHITEFQRCPFGMIWRIQKYIKKGYIVQIQDYLKIFENWDNAELSVRLDLIKYTKQIEAEIAAKGWAAQESYDELYSKLRFD